MRLLIIGIIKGALASAAKIAMDRGANIVTADTIPHALSILRMRGADLIFMDMDLPIGRLFESLKLDRITTPIVACGIDPTPEAASDCIRAGAREFIPLPPDPELISSILEAVVNEKQSLIWRDPAMEKVIRLAESVARSDASILISGESGTGKEMVARLIHDKSSRAKMPFISINCAAIPDALLESELFGHEKGAFTGASARRIGKFEEANGGTLLLDEISEMDVRLQAKLLRAIQERVIDRIGGSRPVPVNIRIIATTNRNMLDEVSNGNFREDLYFRLNVIGIRVPPLRDRTQDILTLATHFIGKFSQMNDIPSPKLTTDAKRLLLSAYWRGNVRELENVIHRAVLLSNGADIDPEAIVIEASNPLKSRPDIASQAASTADAVSRQLIGKTVTEVERQLIFDTLEHCLGNRTQAAKILGISIRTLRNKLNDYVAEGFIKRESLI